MKVFHELGLINPDFNWQNVINVTNVYKMTDFGMICRDHSIQNPSQLKISSFKRIPFCQDTADFEDNEAFFYGIRFVFLCVFIDNP